MSRRSAGAFRPKLRELDRELTIPIPDRLRILSELEFDLEQLKSRFVAQGMSAAEARRRALEDLVPEGATLDELQRLHEPAYAHITRGWDGAWLQRVERIALALATAGVLVTETLALLRADLLSDASIFLWPVLALGAVLFTASAAKAFQLWVKADHRAPSRGLGTILGLAGATLATGAGGVLLDFTRLAASLERDPQLAGGLFLDWLVRDAALMAVALLIALAGGVAWFVLSQWVAHLSSARHAVLGSTTRTTSKEIRNAR